MKISKLKKISITLLSIILFSIILCVIIFVIGPYTKINNKNQNSNNNQYTWENKQIDQILNDNMQLDFYGQFLNFSKNPYTLKIDHIDWNKINEMFKLCLEKDNENQKNKIDLQKYNLVVNTKAEIVDNKRIKFIIDWFYKNNKSNYLYNNIKYYDIVILQYY